MAHSSSLAWRTLAATALMSATLSGCGGGAPEAAAPVAALPPAASAPTLAGLLQQEAALPAFEVKPAYHMAPVQPAEPGNIDQGNGQASAAAPVHRETVRPELAQVNTAGLTPARLQGLLRGLAPVIAQGTPVAAQGTAAAPLAATPLTAQVYTPAQIRAAYGLPPLPATGVTPTPAQAAALGAGQTLYIVDAQDNPNAAADLATFSTKFGLPQCTAFSLPAGTKLPLASASLTAGCQFAVAYADTGANLTNTAPAYDANWSMEIALDVQWAHAIAPYARIILIEAPSANGLYLAAAARLANAMGPGIVSMSFGSPESALLTMLEDVLSFNGTGMSYFASTGDGGSGVLWPSVSSKVVAVGGTTLNYSPSVARNESTWSGTGGGISAVVATPAYQSKIKLGGQTALAHRAVADVSMNADPYSGQYIVVTPPKGVAAWQVVGGTSMSCPEWAALAAVGNALRANLKLAPVTDIQGLLYTQIAATPGTYAADFYDVTTGNDGTCATCSATSGYDPATGLGTPNASALFSTWTSLAPPPLPSTSLPSGLAGLPYRVQWATTDKQNSPLTYTLTNAPAGLTVAAGALTWSTPVPGNYVFNVTVQNAAGMPASEALGLTIAPANPVITSANLSATTGQAFSASVSASDPNHGTLSLTLKGAPAGLTVSGTTLQWANPATGTYSFSVTATSSAGTSATAVYTLTVKAPILPPVFKGVSLAATVGVPFNATLLATDSNAGAHLLYSVTGAPASLGLNPVTGGLTWMNPTPGTWPLQVTARDQFGATATTTVTLTATGGVPVLTSTSFSLRAGSAWHGQLTASVAAGGAMTYAVAGPLPSGLTMSSAGALSWARPVAGVTRLALTVRSATTGLTGTGTLTLSVN